MSSPAHEQLLGYCLDALEPAEREQLERELACDPELRAQLARLAASIEPLATLQETEEPPPGLAQRACELVFEHIDHVEVVDRNVAPAREGVSAAMSREFAAGRSAWSVADLVVTGGIFLAAGMLFFPAIANSRYQAHMLQCQNGLRQYGLADAKYRDLHGNQDLNIAEMKGNRAAVGIQPVMLHDSGLLPSCSVMNCPGAPEAQRTEPDDFPRIQQIDNAESTQELAALLRAAAGSYYLSLGHRPAPNDEPIDADFYALASDAPSGMYPHLVSTHHDGRGQNLVFASGRVAYIRGSGAAECGDPIFVNDQGKVDIGDDATDVVLAPGGTWPFGTSRK